MVRTNGAPPVHRRGVITTLAFAEHGSKLARGRLLASRRPGRYLPPMTPADLIQSAIDVNAVARAELIEACDALSESRRLERWYGDNEWSLHDIVAHIAVWQDAAARG